MILSAFKKDYRQRIDKKYLKLSDQYSRIFVVQNINNLSFDHLERKVSTYLRRRYERTFYTVAFQAKERFYKEKFKKQQEDSARE